MRGRCLQPASEELLSQQDGVRDPLPKCDFDRTTVKVDIYMPTPECLLLTSCTQVTDLSLSSERGWCWLAIPNFILTTL